MKILFAGTPDIAVPLLKEIAKKYNVVGVLTNEDKPGSRGKNLIPTPVKVAALNLGIPVFQFSTLKTEARKELKKLGAEVLISFAYGRIFGPKFLAMFPKAKLNVHPSILPSFRGPSPIQGAIIEGVRQTGISVQEIDLKMDEGRICALETFSLFGKETTSELTDFVSSKVPSIVIPVLDKLEEETIEFLPQKGIPSYTNIVNKEDGKIDFNKSALEIHSLIRGMYPWPKAYAIYKGQKLFLTSVWGGFDDIEKEERLINISPGKVICYNKKKGIAIACKDCPVWVTGFQVPTKKELDYKSFINGNRDILESTLE